ncbi:MAG: SH3 domain-containing protein, partial [Sodaliphilus sp.]|nr:SH3 domain-containing protein [Sodaliphilus sp.]
MKKGLLIALMLCICGFVNAQRVFTLVYAISDDGFVNIRATPSASGKVVGQVYGMLHGLGNAEKIGQVDGWTKVKKDNVVGYARTKYLECQTWCNGGSPRIVAKKATPIYGEDFSGESAT